MESLHLLQVSDTHLVANGAERGAAVASAYHEMAGRSTADALAAVLAAVAASGFDPDLVVHTGDVVDRPDGDSYELAGRMLATLGAPTVAVAGNHDEPTLLATAMGGDRVLERDGWSLVLVESRVPGHDGGAVGAAGLSWLDQRLSSTDAHVVLGLHHPPISSCPDPDCVLADRDDLFAVLDRHPNVRAVLSGHLHATGETERRGVRYLLAPSTCLQLRHVHPLAEHNRAPTPVGARVVELRSDGGIRTGVIWA
jgi:Icc protein